MPPAAKPNGTISKFFSVQPARAPKRPAEAIDLTLSDADDDDRPRTPPAAKKPKTDPPRDPVAGPSSSAAISKFFTPVKSRSTQPASTTPSRALLDSPVSKYVFRGTPNGRKSDGRIGGNEDSDEEMLSQAEVDARNARRAAFRSKLGGRFERAEADALRIDEDRTYDDLDIQDKGKTKDDEEEDDAEEDVVELPSAVSSKLKSFAATSTASQPAARKAVKDAPSKPSAKSKSKKADEIGPSGLKYTPLEKQVAAAKAEHPDCLLLFEVGYKYRMFGTDAQIASKELGIACWIDRNFHTASIPVHRKAVHVKKLISQGHKVGVIGQTETAALKKVGDNRSGPFERKLTELYTAATFVDDLDSADEMSDETRASPPSLTCFVESLLGGKVADQRVLLGMVSVIPSTGEVTYDEWEDGHMRTELETRITHIRPSELLIPSSKLLSKSTEKMLEYFTGNKRFNAGRNIRVERFEDPMSYEEAFTSVSDFYNQSEKAQHKGKIIATIVDFPKKVVIALAHTIRYLAAFKVADAFLEATFFATFASRTHMLLNGTTLTNLEIYRNSTDFTEKGSLLWVLDHTKTKFGSRMLKSWIGRPLTNRTILQERIDAVEEIITDPPPTYDRIKTILKGLPDLVKGLARITYGTCSPKELATLLTAYQRIANLFEPTATSGFKSPLWNDIIAALPHLRKPISELTDTFSLHKARFDSPKEDLWMDDDKFPDLDMCKFAIAAIESEFEDELKQIRKTLKRPGLKWVSVAGNEYLIEIRHADSKVVPPNWLRVSSTKAVIRYHTPEVKKKLAERDRHKEALVLEAEKAWQSFLTEVSQHYAIFRDITNKLAIADCLQSLAAVALQPGYTRPEIVDDDRLHIAEGRHPMAEVIRSDPFVPNTVLLGGADTRTKVITGPNMNGKSTCCRMIALITIMAQIGSYVPAASASLGLHDCVLTRMGASDDLARGQSTFMVELQETSDIMRQASPRSLIILDELGRGTSTHDGQAIASAVLHYLQTVKRPKVLFITHYPLLAAEFAEEFDDVANLHMAHGHGLKRPDGTTSVNFLYRLSAGMATGSYGIECGRLAGMPRAVLNVAQVRSDAMKLEIEKAAGSRKWRALLEVALNETVPFAERCVALRKLRNTVL